MALEADSCQSNVCADIIAFAIGSSSCQCSRSSVPLRPYFFNSFNKGPRRINEANAAGLAAPPLIIAGVLNYLGWRWLRSQLLPVMVLCWSVSLVLTHASHLALACRGARRRIREVEGKEVGRTLGHVPPISNSIQIEITISFSHKLCRYNKREARSSSADVDKWTRLSIKISGPIYSADLIYMFIRRISPELFSTSLLLFLSSYYSFSSSCIPNSHFLSISFYTSNFYFNGKKQQRFNNWILR